MSEPPHATSPDPPAQRPSLVVGLGASAGGIPALNTFFAHVAPQSRVAYVVILHLSPDHESRLAEVLQTKSPIPVAQVTERVLIEAGHVYVVPPNRSLSVVDGHLFLAEFTRVEQRRATVDLFFRALADAHGSRSAAVVLSGTGSDGSSGIKRVKEYGGLTIAQDPDEAQHGDMPRSSIATGLVDLVLPAAAMPSRIASYAERLAREDGWNVPEDGGARRAENDDPIQDVLTVLRIRTGHDFSNYKHATLHRRVQRRVHVRGLPNLATYARALRQQPDEAVALMKELLISVTNFFRDPAAFEALAVRIVPRLFDGKRPEDQIRVWVAGCATGEEAYSIAMLLCEHASGLTGAPSIQVFATDLDHQAIATAREAAYTNAEVADVSEIRLRRYFDKGPAGYRVRREIREMVLFAHHNVITDPPFSHLDLISCRNLLIYLNRSVQDRVLETFHFALRSGRYLFLSTSESPDTAHPLFVPIDKDAHIYESRAVTLRVGRRLPDLPGVPLAPAKASGGRSAERGVPADLHHRLLEQYAPPSLLASEEHQVIHLSERVGRYLQVAGGEPSGDLLQLVRPELRMDLRVALHEAARQRTPVKTPLLRLVLDGEERALRLTVRPTLRDGDQARGFFVVFFEESDPASEPHDPVQLPLPAESAVLRLEDEVTQLKRRLQMTIEQYETHAEEAKASNEELQAMNEELRSSAEELETSKEELQSVNEELTTVNEELKIKIEELGVTNNDFQNLMYSSDVATVFLDRSFRVKRFTPAARSVFNLLGGDVGRPLSDITSHIIYPALYDEIHQVLTQLETIDREVKGRDGCWYVMRIRPYRTVDDRIEGVVLTLQDVTEWRRAEQEVRKGEERLRLLIDSAVDYAIFTLGEDGRIDSWNRGAERMFGYAAGEIIGETMDVLFTVEDRAAGVPRSELERAAREGRAPDERYHLRKNGERFYCSGVTTRLDPTAGLGFAKIARDLSEQRRSAEALSAAHLDLERRVQERTRALQTEILERTAAQEHATTLLRKLVTSQEDERARIARDLHDQLGQQLTALRLSLQRLAAEQSSETLHRALAVADAIDSQLGFLAWELRPAVLDDLGIAVALPRYLQEWSTHSGIAAEYRSSGAVSGRLSREAEVAFYRIAQEALNNVVKHAHASRVDVLLEKRDGSVLLVIEDDGIGFTTSARDVARRGLGLAGMQERAALVGATLQVESTPGSGTSLYLRYPTA